MSIYNIIGWLMLLILAIVVGGLATSSNGESFWMGALMTFITLIIIGASCAFLIIAIHLISKS